MVSFKKKEGQKKGRYVLTIPLRVEAWQADKLDKRLEAGRRVYNACLGEAIRRRILVRDNETMKAALALPKKTKEEKEARKLAIEAAQVELNPIGFNVVALQDWSKRLQVGHYIDDHLDGSCRAAISKRAYEAVERWHKDTDGSRAKAYAQLKKIEDPEKRKKIKPELMGKPRFRKRGDFNSITNQAQTNPMMWRDGGVHWPRGKMAHPPKTLKEMAARERQRYERAKVRYAAKGGKEPLRKFWLGYKQDALITNKDFKVMQEEYKARGLELKRTPRVLDKKPLFLPAEPPRNGLPAFDVEDVCTTRVLKEIIRGKPRFFAQLTLRGTPPDYPDKNGSVRPPITLGKGRVGIDIGLSSIGIVSDGKAVLTVFCGDIDFKHREIAKLTRSLERKRRANNPFNYDEKGRIVPKEKRRPWNISKRMKKEENKRRELHRKLAAQRKCLHGQLVRLVLSMGNEVYTESLSYKAWQKVWGKTVGHRAPGGFIALLKQKAKMLGGEVIEFDTNTTKLSKTCHGCGAEVKKELRQRRHICDCGVKGQRDLYSAFLARHVFFEEVENGDKTRLVARLDLNSAEDEWEYYKGQIEVTALESRLRTKEGRISICAPSNGGR